MFQCVWPEKHLHGAGAGGESSHGQCETILISDEKELSLL